MMEPMTNISNGQRDGVPFLLFRIRQYLCGLPLHHVVEIMRPQPVEPIVGAPVGVMGAAVIRGMPLPVLDLGFLLDGTDEAATRFVTIKAGGHSVALAVTSVVGLRDLPVDIISGIPALFSGANAHTISAIGTLDAELLVVLNTAHLVPESVWQALNEQALDGQGQNIERAPDVPEESA